MAGTIPTYESIGVRPLINCKGTFTIVGGSLMLPEVKQAMVAASEGYVHLDELMEQVGSRIASRCFLLSFRLRAKTLVA